MTDTTLRYYKSTIALMNSREKRLSDMKKRFRTRVSRRRARQQIHSMMSRMAIN